MAVLYRKYRPQTFAEVLGQKHIIRTLKNQVAAGSVAHAYLFTGSRGIGKTTLARLLAKAVNCENRAKGEGLRAKSDEGDPCGKCANCMAIQNGNFLDLVEIDAASNTGVDNIRDLVEHVRFSPSVGKYKVFIIDEVHMLSKGAFNALLKTLEEPPQHAIFVLATTEANKVPATIISRTQRFDFKLLEPGELAEHLEKILKAEHFKLNKEILRLIADNAEGSVRDALSLLDKVITLGEDATLEDCQQLLGITDFGVCHRLLGHILAGKMAEIPAFFDNLSEQGADLAVFNRDFLEYLRKILIFQVSGGGLSGLAKEHEEEIKKQAALANPQELIFIVRLFLKSYKDLNSSPRGEIPLLLAALEAAQRRSGKSDKSENQKIGSAVLSAPVKQPTVVVSNHPETKKDEVAELSADDETPLAEAITLEEVRAWWPKFIAELKKRNCPLASLIKTASLDGVLGRAIIVGVKFNFDKANLENAKNQAMISSVIREISGKPLAVRGAVIKPLAAEGAAVNLGDVLKVFGGELIE